MWTKDFWKGLGERSIKTFIQAFLSSLFVTSGAALSAVLAGTGVITPEAALALPLPTALSTAVVASLISAAMSIGNAEFTAGAEPRRALPEKE